jgi:hypothetical protein
VNGPSKRCTRPIGRPSSAVESAAHDRDLIARARAIAACETPADIMAAIASRDGAPATYVNGAEYAAGFGRAQALLDELARMAERLLDGAR